MDQHHDHQGEDTGEVSKRVVWAAMMACLIFFSVWGILFSVPLGFPVSSTDVFTVKKGATLESVASDLQDAGLIRFAAAFRVVVWFRGAGRSVVAGDYVFGTPIDTVDVASRLVRGQFNLVPVKVTIPEGLNKFEIAALLQKKIARFDSAHFIELASEGYLFPDTYFFARNATPEMIIDTMNENFKRKTIPLEGAMRAAGRTREQVVAMASIIELEARQTETRKIIAGILWKRFDSKMPLQVDVSFKYINGKTTKQLTDADLKIDSPYNSYKYRGLPPTAIGNPGLDALIATLEPTKTPYFFFLSDHDGVMHYAKTFDEHKKNRELYM